MHWRRLTAIPQRMHEQRITSTTLHKRLALLACILGSTVVGIDGSAIGVALPAIREELGGRLAGQQWAANG